LRDSGKGRRAVRRQPAVVRVANALLGVGAGRKLAVAVVPALVPGGASQSCPKLPLQGQGRRRLNKLRLPTSEGTKQPGGDPRKE